MKIFIGYRDIDSGAKVATEHLFQSFKKIDPHSEFIVYKQTPYRYAGALSFTKNFFWSVSDFVKKLNKTNKNLTAIYSPYYLLYLAKLFSKHRHVPFYFHLHGNQAETKLPIHKKNFLDIRYAYTALINYIITLIQKKTIKQAHQVFFVSEKARKKFLQQYKISLPIKKYAIIPNGVSFKRFFPITKSKKVSKKKKLINDSKALALLYVGRIDHKKGVLELVKSFSEVKTTKKLHLIIIHPDIPDKYSQQYLNDLKKESRLTTAKVTFLKNPRKLVDYYQIADLVILPSYQEMMPLVMLEAFACGVPFIGSAAGNMQEILQQVDKNLILQKISPKSIAKHINWFLKITPKKRQQIISLERKIAKKFSWNKSAEKIILQLNQSH